MKKKIVLFVLSLFLIYSAFAKNDIQLNLGSSLVQPFTLINHNYFGESQSFGIGETVSFGTSEMPYTSILVGPAFRTVDKRSESQMISGFKFYFSKTREISYGNYTDIELINDFISTGYALGIDYQYKYFANKVLSLILGQSIAVGMNYSWNVQKPVDKNKVAVYKSIHGEKESTFFFDIEPYIGFSININ